MLTLGDGGRERGGGSHDHHHGSFWIARMNILVLRNACCARSFRFSFYAVDWWTPIPGSRDVVPRQRLKPQRIWKFTIVMIAVVAHDLPCWRCLIWVRYVPAVLAHLQYWLIIQMMPTWDRNGAAVKVQRSCDRVWFPMHANALVSFLFPLLTFRSYTLLGVILTYDLTRPNMTWPS